MTFWSELREMIGHRDVDRPEARDMAREIVQRHPDEFADLDGIPAEDFGPLTTAARDAGNESEVDRLTCWVMVQFWHRKVVSYGATGSNGPVPQAFIEAVADLELDPARS